MEDASRMRRAGLRLGVIGAVALAAVALSLAHPGGARAASCSVVPLPVDPNNFIQQNTMVVTIGSGESVSLAVAEDQFPGITNAYTVSGGGIVDTTCGGATIREIRSVTVNGAGGNETLTLTGMWIHSQRKEALLIPFCPPSGLCPRPTTFAIDLGAGTDLLVVNGTTSVSDKFYFGATGLNYSYQGPDSAFSNDPKVSLAGIDAYTVNGGQELNGGTSAGGDSISGQGSIFSGTSDGPVTGPMIINGQGGLDFLEGGSGNDTITAGVDSFDVDTIYGRAGDDTLTGGPGKDTIDGGPGTDDMHGGANTDTVSYGTRSADITATLDDLANDGVPGENDRIRQDVENLTGGSGNDTLTGDAFPNTITGGPGNDTLYGLGGGDTFPGDLGADIAYGGPDGDMFTEFGVPDEGDVLDGGADYDVVNYGVHANGVHVSLDGVANDGDPTANGGAGEGDNVVNMEQINGSEGPDVLVGNDSANSIYAGGGDDEITGGLGNDTEVGGYGNDVFHQGSAPDGNDVIYGQLASGSDAWADVVDYSARTTGVTINLPGFGGAPMVENDQITEVADALGGSGNDTITAGNEGSPPFANVLSGGDGDDTIQGALGIDTLTGGLGQDTVSYSNAPSGVTVNLATQTVSGGDGADLISGFENAIGSASGDTLTGSDDPNRLDGLGGADTIAGAGADDLLYGGAGNDTITGGDGPDTLDGGADADDLQGGNGIDYLAGGEGTDVLQGGADGDRLEGGNGADSLSGGDGDDLLIERGYDMNGLTANGGDTIGGGLGFDTVDYSSRNSGISFSWDGVANDGQAGEGDNIGSDVEAGTGGNGSDWFIQPAMPNGPQKMNGGPGVDTIDYALRPIAVNVSLDDFPNDGQAMEFDNVGSDIENVATGGGNDQITGSSANNRFYSSPGDDNVQGLGGADQFDTGSAPDGADTLDGGSGEDVISYLDRSAGVTVNQSDMTNNDGEAGENDRVLGIEHVLGTIQNDTLVGGSGDDYLEGIYGDDVLVGNGGNDQLYSGGGTSQFTGGPGDDWMQSYGGSAVFHEGSAPNGQDVLIAGGDSTVDYSGRSGAVSITDDGTQNDGEAGENDYIYPTHTIKTGSGADVVQLSGGCDGDPYAAHTVSTGAGDDTIEMGACNATITAGAGTDSLGYLAASAAVTLDLGTSTATLGGFTQTFSGVENGAGSPQGDTITGSDVGETLSGRAGADTIRGGGGADTLNGDGGADVLDGQAGNDTENGGADADTFDQGSAPNGGDVLDGGAGMDSVDYRGRSVVAAVTFDGVANDGEPMEFDNVLDTVEISLVLTFPQLTVTKDGTGAGTVTSSPAGIDCGATCTSTHPEGTTVTLTATPASSSTFTGWTVTGFTCSGTGTCDVPMGVARAVKATFTLKTHALAVTNLNPTLGTVSTTGAVMGINCGVDCDETYNDGTIVTLVASPNTNAQFAGWGGACTGLSGTCQVTMTQARTVTASFAVATWLLSVTNQNPTLGTVTGTGINCGNDCSETFEHASLVALTATPDPNSLFVGWGGACASSGTGPCSVAMTQARSVTAAFALVKRSLTVVNQNPTLGKVTATGIDCGSDCSEDYDHGTVVTLTPVPGSGASFAGWSGACSGAGACQVTMDAVKAVVAAFTANVFRPDALVRVGTGSFAGNNVYNATGASQSRTAQTKARKSATFYLQAANDGNVADSLKVKGTKGGGKFTVKYLLGRTNVTASVVAGTLTLPSVGPGSNMLLKIVVTVKKGAKVKSSKAFLLTVSSVAQPALKDAVKAIVKVKK